MVLDLTRYTSNGRRIKSKKVCHFANATEFDRIKSKGTSIAPDFSSSEENSHQPRPVVYWSAQEWTRESSVADRERDPSRSSDFRFFPRKRVMRNSLWTKWRFGSTQKVWAYGLRDRSIWHIWLRTRMRADTSRISTCAVNLLDEMFLLRKFCNTIFVGSKLSWANPMLYY